MHIVIRILFYLAALFIVVGGQPMSVVAQQQSELPQGEAYFPGNQSPFDSAAANQSVYREVVLIPALPSLQPGNPLAQPLRPSTQPPTASPNASHSVALAAYEDEEEPATTAAPAPATAPSGFWWIEEPKFTFGGLFPTNDQIQDTAYLSMLKQSLDDLKAQLESDSSVTDETRKTWERALEWHRDGVKTLDQIAQLQKEIENQPNVVASLEAAINQPLPALPESLEPGIELEIHEARAKEFEAHVQRLRSELDKENELIRERAEKPNALTQIEQTLEDRLATARERTRNQSRADLADKIKLVEQQAIVIATRIQIRSNRLESQRLAATEKTTFLKQESLKRQLEHAQARSRQYSALVSQRSDEMIKEAAEKARAEVMAAHPLLRDLAKENADLAEQRELISRINRSNRSEQEELDKRLESVKQSREKLDEHLQAARHSTAVGLLLRFERTRLPQTSASQQRILEIESALPDLKLEQLKINDKRTRLPDQQAAIEKSVEELDQQESSVMSGSELSVKAGELLVQKRNFLLELNSEYDTYLNGLARLQQSHQQLLDETTELRSWIDQHVLWIRSADPIDSSDIRKSLEAIRSIGSSDHWQATMSFLSSQLNGRWLLISILLLGLWLGIGMRKQLDRRLRHVCRRRSEFRVSPLVRSLLLTLFQASLLPAMIATLGYMLSDSIESFTLKESISRGLLMISPQLFIAFFVCRLAIPGGLAETQLGWSRDVCKTVRRSTATIVRYCLPLIAVTEALQTFQDGQWIDSLGRLVFISAMLVLAVASFQLLRGVGRAWKEDPESSHSIWEQTFALWSPLVVAGPVALVCVAALGYMYSSVFLGIRLLMTWWLILGVVSFFYLTKRVIEIGYNIIVARRRWRDTEAESESTSNLAIDSELSGVRIQVTRLLHVTSVMFCLLMAYSFWADVIPAIQALDYGIWQVERPVEVAGPNDTRVVEVQLTAVTIGDVLRFLFALAATFVLSRNIPGLLQMVVLDRLPLDRGGKYAISIVCRYVVATIGLVLACRMIGFTWSSVQWLVAAMSVGLGFGLQEIFANFVAGIIILLERPIRVGDYVTVNGTTGFVTRIQLRATMIIDFDRRELIVPNKKFITDDVINWTLSDSITRVVVPVGIAYGSDTRLAQSVLLRVARDNSGVLRDPRPEVIFTRFGGSSLDFELRVHIGNREEYHDIMHQLHMAIDQEFRKQNIEIAFPQQDVNVKGIEPLIRMAETTRVRKRKAG